jgi:hypothetical protein
MAAGASLSITGVRGAIIAVVAIRIAATAAIGGIEDAEAVLGIAGIGGAGALIITNHGGSGRTVPRLTVFVSIADITIIAKVGVVIDRLAARGGIAAVVGAGILIVAAHGLAATETLGTGVVFRAGIAIVASVGVVGVIKAISR